MLTVPRAVIINRLFGNESNATPEQSPTTSSTRAFLLFQERNEEPQSLMYKNRRVPSYPY